MHGLYEHMTYDACSLHVYVSVCMHLRMYLCIHMYVRTYCMYVHMCACIVGTASRGKHNLKHWMLVQT